MQIFIHRVNTLEKLAEVPTKYGLEIDIRGFGGKLLLNHDPVDVNQDYDELEQFLIAAKDHAGIILNVKEAGYEQRVLDLVEKYGIADYFLLDVEFPYLYAATRKLGVRDIAVRYSEAEPIEAVEAQMVAGNPLLDWVWIDTNTTLPLDADTVHRLRSFKTCLVCPERWGRAEDIEPYATKMRELNFTPTAVMTALSQVEKWESVMN